MPEPDVLERMRADWNKRAGEDAYYYVAFGRREQGTDEFFSSASHVLPALLPELTRLRERSAALEIGCGPGRLLKPMSTHFAEVHGVDVSDEMIELARERLRGVPNAFPHHGSGSDLAMFAASSFDFVYSYAVFQHIPSRDVVFNYLREARRVLKTGGVLRCQINGLPPHARQYDTWSGVRIAADEMRAFAREQDFQLLALDGIWTQYMWITCRKMPEGWEARAGGPAKPGAVLRSVSNAHTGEAVVPCSGPLAAMSLWIQDLPDDSDLNHLEVTAEGKPCRLSYLGEPGRDGVSQLNAALPAAIRTGFVAVDVHRGGSAVCPTGWVRVMPAGPAVPRVWGVMDGVNLLSGTRIVSGAVKVTMAEVERPDQFRATVDGRAVREVEHFCVDPLPMHYEFNFLLPDKLPAGAHRLELSLGTRAFAPVGIEVL